MWPGFVSFFHATVNYATIFNVTVSNWPENPLKSYISYTTCKIIASMTKIQIAQQRKSDLAQLVFSTDIDSP